METNPANSQKPANKFKPYAVDGSFTGGWKAQEKEQMLAKVARIRKELESKGKPQ